MTSPRYARIAARLLAQEQPATVEVNEAKRARAIGAIAEALAAKSQRRLRRNWGLGLTTAAAAGLLGYLGIHKLTPSANHPPPESVSAVAKPSGSGTIIWGTAGHHALLNDAQLQQGGHLVAGNGGGATVQLSTGTELVVEHDTTLAFESADRSERFFLSQGALRAKVAKLLDGQQFIVRTLDAEVEVRGTAFRVEVVAPDVTCGGGTRTRVSVSEGLVEVRGADASTYVHPGETWPAGCAKHAVGAKADSPGVAAPTSLDETALRAPALRDNHDEVQAQAARGAASGAGFKIVHEPSSIARENELFSQAAAASRRGDNQAALGSFEQLIARYPASPLAESAAVQRMSLLAHFDPTAARNAAREYLVRYPQGYAKADAQKLLAQP